MRGFHFADERLCTLRDLAGVCRLVRCIHEQATRHFHLPQTIHDVGSKCQRGPQARQHHAHGPWAHGRVHDAQRERGSEWHPSDVTDSLVARARRGTALSDALVGGGAATLILRRGERGSDRGDDLDAEVQQRLTARAHDADRDGTQGHGREQTPSELTLSGPRFRAQLGVHQRGRVATPELHPGAPSITHARRNHSTGAPAGVFTAALAIGEACART
mmetsp:Transcript_75717/g.245358  ORF Transcript_75717/g.245358 Transcript_75717/m.245358 type:complete len:218 (-) Transcript_75717:921-1574(-)